MNVYWVYDLPTWLFGLLTVAVTVAVGLGGFYLTRKWVRRVHGDEYREFDRILELRRMRLQSVVTGLPSPLWSVVLVGALLNIAVTWFFDMRSQSMHFWMTVMFSGLLGLLIFLLAAMDNPFRGEISVGPEAFELVYERLMKPGK